MVPIVIFLILSPSLITVYKNADLTTVVAVVAATTVVVVVLDSF